MAACVALLTDDDIDKWRGDGNDVGRDDNGAGA